ncbi:MAG: WYL domain-containing protein [Thermodesulfobacteriota bacterium]
MIQTKKLHKSLKPMPRNKVQLQRLIFVDRQIRKGMKTGTLVNCSSMAAEYEVSYKSIMRDIDYLKYQCDAPIEYDASRHGFFYTEDSWQLPAISINESDLFAICIARKALQQHRNTPIYGKLSAIFDKIENSLPDRVTVSPSWVDDRVSMFSDHRTDINPQIWDRVAKALHQSKRLQIDYLKPGAAEPEAREIDPYHVVNFQGEWYLVGFCHLRKEIRTFAISRIKEASESATTFAIPEDFNFAAFSGSHFGIFRGDEEQEVVISFAKEHAPYVREREWHPQQSIHEEKDGALLLSFTTNHLFEVKRWIMSWGSGVKVIAPEKLRDDILLEVRKVMQAYD